MADYSSNQYQVRGLGSSREEGRGDYLGGGDGSGEEEGGEEEEDDDEEEEEEDDDEDDDEEEQDEEEEDEEEDDEEEDDDEEEEDDDEVSRLPGPIFPGDIAPFDEAEQRLLQDNLNNVFTQNLPNFREQFALRVQTPSWVEQNPGVSELEYIWATIYYNFPQLRWLVEFVIRTLTQNNADFEHIGLSLEQRILDTRRLFSTCFIDQMPNILAENQGLHLSYWNVRYAQLFQLRQDIRDFVRQELPQVYQDLRRLWDLIDDMFPDESINSQTLADLHAHELFRLRRQESRFAVVPIDSSKTPITLTPADLRRVNYIVRRLWTSRRSLALDVAQAFYSEYRNDEYVTQRLRSLVADLGWARQVEGLDTSQEEQALSGFDAIEQGQNFNGDVAAVEPYILEVIYGTNDPEDFEPKEYNQVLENIEWMNFNQHFERADLIARAYFWHQPEMRTPIMHYTVDRLVRLVNQGRYPLNLQQQLTWFEQALSGGIASPPHPDLLGTERDFACEFHPPEPTRSSFDGFGQQVQNRIASSLQDPPPMTQIHRDVIGREMIQHLMWLCESLLEAYEMHELFPAVVAVFPEIRRILWERIHFECINNDRPDEDQSFLSRFWSIARGQATRADTGNVPDQDLLYYLQDFRTRLGLPHRSLYEWHLPPVEITEVAREPERRTGIPGSLRPHDVQEFRDAVLNFVSDVQGQKMAKIQKEKAVMTQDMLEIYQDPSLLTSTPEEAAEALREFWRLHEHGTGGVARALIEHFANTLHHPHAVSVFVRARNRINDIDSFMLFTHHNARDQDLIERQVQEIAANWGLLHPNQTFNRADRTFRYRRFLPVEDRDLALPTRIDAFDLRNYGLEFIAALHQLSRISRDQHDRALRRIQLARHARRFDEPSLSDAVHVTAHDLRTAIDQWNENIELDAEPVLSEDPMEVEMTPPRPERGESDTDLYANPTPPPGSGGERDSLASKRGNSKSQPPSSDSAKDSKGKKRKSDGYEDRPAKKAKQSPTPKSSASTKSSKSSQGSKSPREKDGVLEMLRQIGDLKEDENMPSSSESSPEESSSSASKRPAKSPVKNDGVLDMLAQINNLAPGENLSSSSFEDGSPQEPNPQVTQESEDPASSHSESDSDSDSTTDAAPEPESQSQSAPQPPPRGRFPTPSPATPPPPPPLPTNNPPSTSPLSPTLSLSTPSASPEPEPKRSADKTFRSRASPADNARNWGRILRPRPQEVTYNETAAAAKKGAKAAAKAAPKKGAAKKGAAKKGAAKKGAAKKDAAKETAKKETAKKETAKKETAKKETAKKETAKKETAKKGAAAADTDAAPAKKAAKRGGGAAAVRARRDRGGGARGGAGARGGRGGAAGAAAGVRDGGVKKSRGRGGARGAKGGRGGRGGRGAKK